MFTVVMIITVICKFSDVRSV